MQIAHLEYKLDNTILTQRTLHLRVGAQDVRLAIDQAARKIRGEVEVPGFRKGKAPLAQVRKHHRERVHDEAFRELRKAAQDQVMKQLPDQDKPFIPPEVVDRDKVKLSYGKQLEFALKYMVDPAGVGKNPEQPEFDQGSVRPGSQISHPSGQRQRCAGLSLIKAKLLFAPCTLHLAGSRERFTGL
ncbi:trigger factor family protein, partial [bacterium]|nr:trigger factor family protein [bacterium]